MLRSKSWCGSIRGMIPSCSHRASGTLSFPIYGAAGSSEQQPHRELHYAGTAADHARRCADGSSDGAADCRGDLTEVRAALIRDRVRKVGVVEDIEEIGAKLKMQPFGGEWEILCRCKVEIFERRTI